MLRRSVRRPVWILRQGFEGLEQFQKRLFIGGRGRRFHRQDVRDILRRNRLARVMHQDAVFEVGRGRHGGKFRLGFAILRDGELLAARDLPEQIGQGGLRFFEGDHLHNCHQNNSPPRGCKAGFAARVICGQVLSGTNDAPLDDERQFARRADFGRGFHVLDRSRNDFNPLPLERKMVLTLALIPAFSPGEKENRSPLSWNVVRRNWQEGQRAI